MLEQHISDEHPLILEFASLRAAITKYQHEAHTAAVKLQWHSLEASQAVEHARYLERENLRLKDEVATLRASPDTTPSTAALQIPELTLALRKLSDKLTHTEQSLLSRTNELLQAQSALRQAGHAADSIHSLLSQTRSKEDTYRVRERELEKRLRAAEEERRMSDLVVQEYADLVRSLEGRSKNSSRSSLALATNSNGSCATLAESLAEGKLGLQRLLEEFNGESERLASDISGLHAEIEDLTAQLQSERQSAEEDRSQLASFIVELDKYKADDNTATKMVSRYMKFSQSTTDSLQQAMESLRTRQTATVATLNVQLDNLQKALLSERQQTESLRRALDDLSEDLSREAYGRRREISLRLAFLSREEGLAESLRRWIRKSKESFERIHSQDTPPSDNETTLQVVANRTLQDAEGLLESLNGQPALSEDSAGSVARVVASQEAVLYLTRELQYETDRRLQAESRLIQEYLDTSSARMEEPHIDPMGSIVHPTSSDDKGPQTIEPGEKPSPQHTPSSEVVTVALEPTSKESENELVEEPPSRSQISPEDVPSHAEPVVHQLEDQAVSPSIIVADESPETESPSLTNASLTQNPLETTETLETSIPNILPISDTPSDLTTLTSPISPQTLEITQQVPEEDPAEPHLGTPVDSAFTDDRLDVITKDPAVVVEANPEQRHSSSDLGATGIAAVDPSQSPPTSPQLLTTPVLSSPIAPHPSLPVEAPSHCPSPTSETETETTNCEEVETLPPPSSCVRQSDEPGGGEPHILDVVVPALDAEEEPALRVDSHMHIEVQSSLTGPPIERLDEDEGKALPLIVPTNVHVEEPSFGALPTEDNPVSLSPEPTKEPLPKPPTPKTRAAPPLLLELSPVEGAEIASACLVSPPVPSQAQLIFPTIEDSKTDTPNPKVSLLADLARVRHRYDDLQKAFRDCNLALKELKKNITTSLPSTHPLYQVIQAAVERLDDFNEDARVELEIRVADEERISAGYETLLSVPGAISNSDEVNESEVEVEIKAFIDGSDKGVVKAKERFGKQLEDLQHDIASVKHAMHESPSEVTSPTPTPTLSPASTLSPLYPAHPPVSAPLTKTTGWSSWAGGLLGSPRTAQPVSAARTFGSVMTSPRLRHASFSHLTPNSTSIANGRNTHEECIPNTPNPFASLGLRISMPSHLLTNHSISSTTIYPETSTVSLKPQSSSYSYLSRSPLAGGTGLGGPQKARASSASAMYMLGLGARSGSALPLSSGRSSSGQDLGSSRGSSLGLRSGTGQAFPTMDNGSEDTHKEVEDLNSDIE